MASNTTCAALLYECVVVIYG